MPSRGKVVTSYSFPAAFFALSIQSPGKNAPNLLALNSSEEELDIQIDRNSIFFMHGLCGKQLWVENIEGCLTGCVAYFAIFSQIIPSSNYLHGIYSVLGLVSD